VRWPGSSCAAIELFDCLFAGLKRGAFQNFIAISSNYAIAAEAGGRTLRWGLCFLLFLRFVFFVFFFVREVIVFPDVHLERGFGDIARVKNHVVEEGFRTSCAKGWRWRFGERRGGARRFCRRAGRR